MPRNERGTREIAGTVNAWQTSASVGPLPHPATESLLITLCSKSTNTGHRPTSGKALLTAYRQPRLLHRNPQVSSINDDRHRGQMSKRAISSNDAKPMATPYRSDAGHGTAYGRLTLVAVAATLSRASSFSRGLHARISRCGWNSKAWTASSEQTSPIGSRKEVGLGVR
jgi:hypothetical protein